MRLISGLSLGFVLLAAGGCTRWRHTHPLPAPDAGPMTFGAARVTSAPGGMMMVLRNVEVTADSVIGWRHPGPPGKPERVALHRSQVLVFERTELDPWKTAGASVLTVVLVYVGVVVYALSTADF